MKHSPRSRKPASLSESLDKQLNLYTLAAKANHVVICAAAASAAGASTLALVPVAEAKIIYTPAHVQILQSGSVFFDFDYGPKSADYDFGIRRGRDCKSVTACLSGMVAFGYRPVSNAIAATAHGFAAALPPGKQMGPHRQVIEQAEMAVVGYDYKYHTTGWSGAWANGGRGLKNGYLGLKFTLNGKVHYGWARVSLTVKGNRFDTATLTGYAFETIPNKPIIVGKTHGPDVVVQHGTLGQLTLGRE